MNRRKKVTSIVKKRAKKANAKLNPSNKPRYISKAEREKIALNEPSAETGSAADSTGPDNSSEAATENPQAE